MPEDLLPFAVTRELGSSRELGAGGAVTTTVPDRPLRRTRISARATGRHAAVAATAPSPVAGRLARCPHRHRSSPTAAPENVASAATW
ncbi:hypothetical protein GCM10009599_02840 [Luteococcus peritonei]